MRRYLLKEMKDLVNLRKDSMVAASEIIVHLEKIVKEKALSTTVATVGKIYCKPNVSNVIPMEVDFYVDIRDVETKGIAMVSKELINKIEEVAMKRDLKYKIDLVGSQIV